MFKKITIFITLLVITFTFSGCTSKAANGTNSGKIKVVVSFNAIREFTEAVGKDKVTVVTLTPNGTEPHEFEPKIKDFENLCDAKLFIYNGLGMEKWADKAIASVDSKTLIAVDASKGCNAIKTSSSNQNDYDPHIWLSLKGAELEAKNIKNALVKADPNNKTYYENNYKSFADKIDALYNGYKDKFDKLQNKNFVTGHAAFAYLCRDFNLKQNSVEDVFADGEPGSKKLSELINYCKTNNIKTIFVEDMVSPKVSETLASEVNGKAEKIYTFESKEDGLDYINGMQDNLERIYNSMK